MRDTQPSLTVAMMVGAERERAAKALQSVLHQNVIDRMEVLVIDCVAPGTPPMKGCDHPAVRVVTIPPPAVFGHLRAEAVREARAPVIAFIEEHCLALTGWAEAILEAHEGPWAAVGGAVYNANATVGFSNITQLSSYTDWLPGTPRQEMVTLPGHNTSYKRDVLLHYDETLGELMMAEGILQWKLHEDGHKLLFDPEVRFAHANESRPKSWIVYYYWSRYLGALRAREREWPRWKRLAYLALFPLSPWVRVGRLLVTLLRKHPTRLWTFFWNIPILLVGLHYAAFGQAMGVVFGAGAVALRFTDYELGLENIR